MNNVLWLVFVLVDLILAVVVFRFFGKQGLYILIVASVIVANIQVTKTILLFGFTATLGNVLYGSTFFATDILSELYGKRQARRAVWLGFVAMGLVVVWMQFGLAFVPGPDDLASDALATIFGMMPRVAAGSLIAYLASQHHDVSAFHFWKARTQGRHLWLRNCASTMVSQAIDSVLFCFIALWGLYDTGTWLEILVTTYALKWLVALLDTPFIYLAVRLHRQGLIQGADSLDG
ncbi:MAG: queuosine precursor transporter [Dehalococcoidia bacterium]|nr:queuosine precursor transporter [Dehalococcoidia bacterium]